MERLDDALIPMLVGVVTKLMSMRRSRSSPDEDESDRGVTFSIREEGVGDIVVINVTGDGNWVQVHPKPDTPREEE